MVQPKFTTSDFIDFIKSKFTATIATKRDGWGVQVATVFYATTDGVDLYMKFQLSSDHAAQIKKDPHVAVAIYDLGSTYAEKYGVQLLGTCRQVTNRAELIKAIDLFSDKFPGARERFSPIDELLSPDVKSTLFRFTPASGKMVMPQGYSDDYQPLN